MTYGFIFSAGKETRFNDVKPKALSFIGDVCLLDFNISILKKYCDKVFVVASIANQHFFTTYEKIVIESGNGCGDAVMKALKSICLNKEDRCFISWGDCILQKDVLDKTVNGYTGKDDIIVPCAIEKNPYVSLHQSQGHITNVKFRKYGEVDGSGYHDFGVFYGMGYPILKHLEAFSSKIIGMGGYHHKHGNEMQFLDVFNETNILGEILVIDDKMPMSFNTKEELYGITKE